MRAGSWPRNYISLDRTPVHHQSYAISFTPAPYRDIITHSLEDATHREPTPRRGNHGRNHQPVIRRTNAEDVLRNRHIVPRSGAGEPGVLRLAMRRRIFSGDHLRVGVRLTTMQPAHLLAGRRIDPKIVFKRSVGIAHQSLRNHHPRIVVAEDA